MGESVFDKSSLEELNVKGRAISDVLKTKGFYKELKNYEPGPEIGKVSYGEGYPITAISKFLGYYDKNLNIAFTPSISIATNFSLAKCTCEYIREKGKDIVSLDGEMSDSYTKRATKALNIFRRITNIEGSFIFKINREKRYEKAKGLGESAAVAAATARALISNVFGEKAARDKDFVSRFARLVSGSGTRSAAGGLAIWISFPSINEAESYAVNMPLDANNFNFAAFPDSHNITTLKAHDTAMSSPFYPAWINGKDDEILQLLSSKMEPKSLMELAEKEMFRLTAILHANGVIIQTEKSLKLIKQIIEFRQNGGNIFMTTDTGPSIVIMSDNKEELEKFVSTQKTKPIYGEIKTEVNYKQND